MDLTTLDSSVQSYFQNGLASSTQKTYRAALKRFHLFCDHFNVTSPFPLSEHTLCCFSAYLADQGLASQTIKTYLSALRSMQISLGLPDPRDQSSMPILKRVQAGISRARLTANSQPRVRLPITARTLAGIHSYLFTSEHPDRLVIWAIASTAFFGFFRLGELLPEAAGNSQSATDLWWGDVAADSHTNPQMIQIHLKRSKCDQFGKGSDIVVGRTGTTICPVAALLRYITARGDKPGPFFLTKSGSAATKPWFVGHIRTALGALGLPQGDFAGHSFRIGAATTAALVGVEDSTIQTLGRWHSSAFLQYIRTPKERLAALSTVLAGGQ